MWKTDMLIHTANLRTDKEHLLRFMRVKKQIDSDISNLF